MLDILNETNGILIKQIKLQCKKYLRIPFLCRSHSLHFTFALFRFYSSLFCLLHITSSCTFVSNFILRFHHTFIPLLFSSLFNFRLYSIEFSQRECSQVEIGELLCKPIRNLFKNFLIHFPIEKKWFLLGSILFRVFVSSVRKKKPPEVSFRCMETWICVCVCIYTANERCI